MTPDLLQVATRVQSLAGQRRWYGKDYEPQPRKETLDLADRVRMHATEHDEMFPGLLARSPFQGITRAKLRDVRFTLQGHVIKYTTVNDELYGRSEPEYGVLSSIRMPFEWAFAALAAPYDVVMAKSWGKPFTEGGTVCSGGTSHVLGLGTFTTFEVMEMDAWNVCHQCGCWRPLVELTQAFDYFVNDNDRELNGGVMRCRRISDSGDCL